MDFENLKINYVLEDVSGHGDFRDSQEFLLGYFEEKENALQYRYDAETVLIEAWGKNSLRVRATKCYKMPEENWALTEVPEKTDAVVKINASETARYPLSENITTEILSGENNEFSNTLVIENGKVRVSSANCPDKICAGHKAVSYTGESIVCLPHKLVIEIKGDNSVPSLDIVA